MRKVIKLNKGISLIEFVLAMALFTVVSLPVFSIFSGAAILMQKSKENIELASVERQVKIEVRDATKNPTEQKLFDYIACLDANNIDTKKLIPNTLGERINFYGFIKYEANKIDKRYMYGLILTDPENIPVHKIFQFGNQTLTQNQIEQRDNLFYPDTVKRYRVEIYKLKSDDLDYKILDSFKLVKLFYVES